MRDLRRLLALGLALFLLAGESSRKATAADGEMPNVVLVMADDQGWGDMAYYGHPKVKTPYFDAMAKETIRFDRFYAQAPVCSPTRGSVMSGRHPNRFACFQWGHPIRPQEVTVAQAFQSAGYRTAHFGKWHLGSVLQGGKSTPGDCGFDQWVSSPNFFDIDPILSDKGKAVQFKGDSSDITAELTVKFIKESAEQKKPFFAVAWFGSPHLPHQALDSDRQFYTDLPKPEQHFLGEITGMDRALGTIRNTIAELGLKQNTILWYCSDNGALPKVGSTGGRRGFKASIYEGGLAVPAMLEWPSRFPQPKVIDTPCVTSDMFPTLLAACNIERPAGPKFDGINLLPILEGKAKERPPIGFWNRPIPGVRTPAKEWMETVFEDQKQGRKTTDPAMFFLNADKIGEPLPLNQFPGHAAWTDGDWKLHRIEQPKKGEIKWELYNLKDDLAETTNLLDEEPERVARMKKGLLAWLESVVRSTNGEDYGSE